MSTLRLLAALVARIKNTRSPFVSEHHAALSGPATLLFLSAAVTVVALMPVVASAHSGGTAADRPLFQAPFPCGQVWQAKTYAGHSPDQDSLDLSEFDSRGINTSAGRSVIASAAGTVIKTVDSGPSGGWGVVIDHGDGWVTANSYHMEHSDPWPISVGQKVAQGQYLGRTGNTGATTVYHQHYTQLDHYHLNAVNAHSANKNAVRVKFDGKNVATHAGYPPGWNNGEEIMSQNCAGNTFMGWYRANTRYHLIYKPRDGSTKIVRMNNDGSVTTTYEKTWTKGWSHFMPFYSSSGMPHAVLYKQASGQYKFVRLGVNGDSVTTVKSGTWAAGWTHFVPFPKYNSWYFLAYSAVHGHANIDRISDSGDGSSTIYSTTWVKGRTQIVRYIQGANRYMLLYEGGTGAVKIVRMDGIGDNITPTTVWTGDWTGGYTTLSLVDHDDELYLLGYKAETGFAKIMRLNDDGQGVSSIKSMNWTTGWTAFAPYSQGGQGRILLYKIGTGQTKTLRLKPNGNGVETVWSGQWTLGWT